MEKAIYLSAFTILGILLQWLAHAVIEIWYIGLLVANSDKYDLGLSWSAWLLIHHIGTAVLFVGGTLFGFRQGQYWWRKVYVDKRLEGSQSVV